jgi:hypothetical protein
MQPERDREAREPGRQLLLSLVVGVPTAISVLRLWVEAGGDLGTTLVLAANIGPVNLLTILITTGTTIAVAVMVAIFALGGIVSASPPDGRRHLIREWSDRFSGPVKAGIFLIAVVTLPILMLPMLLIGYCAAFQVDPYRLAGPLPAGKGVRRLAMAGWTTLFLLALVGWVVLFGPTIRDAYYDREYLPLALLAAPPVLLMLGAAGPVARPVVPVLAKGGLAAIVGMAMLAVYPIVATPILPLTVVTVANGQSGPVTPIRGYVIDVDDTSMAILREQGGIRYVRNSDIRDRILCPDSRDIPLYRLWIYDFHVEDSLLRAVGRKVRPVPPPDRLCRASLLQTENP